MGTFRLRVEGMQGAMPRAASSARKRPLSYLARHGWLYEADAAARYDRARALFPEDLVAWAQATQPGAWDALTKTHGPAAGTVLAERLRMALDKQGTLDDLRAGLDVVGLKQRLALCQFRPALAMNEALQARYAANRLRVVRQVRYSAHGENCLDLVLFLNGIPVATVELKSHYTQSVRDAVDQYRFDRLPKAPGKNVAEPLLAFPGGALVHFAVSNSEAQMCTLLAGADSKFLPFNRGHDFGAGNPPNPNGAPTAYLWEQVWQRDGWLEILGRYLVPVKDDKKKLKGWIFPRFHQLDATRKLVAQVLADGPGGKYLIEHSAGSGKTNSIAWTAHFLADLHDAGSKKVFDTVLVVSDRTVLDKQLREAIEGFERTAGVVAVITGDGGAKSGELAAALAAGKKIVVCTIQTFPFAIQAVRDLSASKGKRFAVIADEAHSSQAGQAAAKLKMTLTAEEQKDLEDGGEASIEDLLAAEMSGRVGQDAGITFVAFTATPKAKTLELFGRRPDPSKPAAKDNLPVAFHTYSMRQAIEEGFILDVLKNYTAYKMAFRLTHAGKEIHEKEVDASEAKKGIMGWVRLHPHNIAARVEIVVEHFRQNVAHLLGGKAKAMVVTAGRKEAVRWMKAMEAYLARKGYAIGLREHAVREALSLRQDAPAAAGLWSRAGGDRSLGAEADAPPDAGPWAAEAEPGRKCASRAAGAGDRDGLGSGAGQAQAAAAGDHLRDQRPVRGGDHRGGRSGLRRQRHQDENAGIRPAPQPGSGEYQGAVHQLPQSQR